MRAFMTPSLASLKLASILLVGALFVARLALSSERVAVYRCAAENGGVSLQDRPCPASSQETLRHLPRPPESAAVPPMPAPPKPVADPPPISKPVQPRAPPPPLWRCLDFDGSERESPDGIPRGRYVPLWVVGRDPYAPAQVIGRVGAPRPQPPLRPSARPTTTVTGVTQSSPLVYVEERCLMLSPAQTCARYAEQRKELERQMFNRQASDRAILRPQADRLRDLLAKHCDR